MTKVIVSDITHSVSVQEAVYKVQIASGASDTQIISVGEGNSLISSTAGVVTSLKTISSGSNITLGDDGETITVSATLDDLSGLTTDNLTEGSNNLYYTAERVDDQVNTLLQAGNGIDLAYDDDAGTLTVTSEVAEFTAKNTEGATITKGTPVYIKGHSGNTTEIGIAYADDPNKMPAFGIAEEDITDNNNGIILTSGVLRGFDTSTFAVGDELYVSTGTLVNTRPTAVNTLVQKVAKVVRSHATNGILFVMGAGRSNDVPNAVSRHLIPDTDNAYDLGSPSAKWRSLYLSGGSLYIEGQKVVGSTDGSIDFTTDDDENMTIFAGGNGTQGTMTLGSAGLVTNIQDTTVNLGPTTLDGTINVRGTLEAPDLHVGDMELSAGVIEQTQTNSNLTLKSNGTGFVYVETSDLYVGDVLTSAVKIDENSISGFNTTVNFIGNLTGAVTGTVSDISNHTTTDLTEGTNLYYTDARVNTLLGTKGYATETYVDTSISNLVDSAPATLDTLNELAAALGDDANFSTTVTNQIATKWTEDATKIANWDTAYSWGDHSVEGYLTSYTETDPIFTGHVASSILSSDITNWNTAYGWGDHSTQGYLTSFTETDPIFQASSWFTTTNNSSNWDLAYSWGDHSTAGYVNSAQAISAVEGEATLDLTGQVTVSQDLDVSGLIKISDGFTLSSFDPYAGSGLPSTAMPTTIMGAGQEEGWAALTVRSRGEHAWGLTGFGIPNEAPRALNVLQAGRLDGGSDDYLNSGDLFGQIMMNPYSGYRTGTEWLTPSATIEAEATENHSSSGMGTKLRIRTTSNGSFAGATDSGHTDGEITIQGTTLTTNSTLKIDDDLIVTGLISNDGGVVAVDDTLKVNSTRVSASEVNTLIGDYTISAANYNAMGLRLNGGDDAWAIATFKEYQGDINSGKPINQFTNPGFATEVIGGTPANPAPLDSGKRVFAMTGTAANDSTGTVAGNANMRILGVTTETQSSTNRGTEIQFQTTSNGSNSAEQSMVIQGNQVIIGSNGDGIIKSSNGNLQLQDDVVVTGDLEVQGTISGVIHPFLLGGM